MIYLLVVPEDLGRAMALILSRTGDRVVVEQRLDKAMTTAQYLQPDVVILDLGEEPDPSVIPKMKEAAPNAAIVILSGILNEELRKALVTSGAHAVASRQSDPAQLAHEAIMAKGLTTDQRITAMEDVLGYGEKKG